MKLFAKTVYIFACSTSLMLPNYTGFMSAIEWLELGATLPQLREQHAKGLAIFQRSENGKTFLIIAVEHNDVPMAGWLLEQGLDPMARMQNGTTALHIAAREGNAEMIDILKAAGATSVLSNEQLPVHYAFNNHRVHVLAEYVNVPLRHECTMLMSACADNHYLMARKLLEIGADVNYVTPTFQYTALKLSIDRGDVRLWQLLIEYNADIDALFHQKTILDDTVLYENTDAFHFFLQQGSIATVSPDMFEVGSIKWNMAHEAKLSRRRTLLVLME